MSSRTFAFLASFFAVAPIAAAQTPAKEPPPLWDVQVGASFVGTSGNSDTSSTGADFLAHRRWPLWQIDAAATAIRTSSHEVQTAERYLASLRGRRKLTDIVSLSAGEKLEKDRFAGIDFRSILDAGLSWALARRPDWTLDAVTALAWNHETPIAGSATNDAAGVLQLFSKVPLSAASDTTQRLTFYPNFSRSGAYRTEAELTAQAAMNSRLALKAGYLVRYSHEPIPGFKTTDSTLTASIVVRWKAATAAPAPSIRRATGSIGCLAPES